MRKNETAEVRIEDITEQGWGIGKVSGFALFVKDTVPGDVVKVRVIKAKKNYGYAKCLEVLVPSEDRIAEKCPAAGPCGGCQLQAMSYPAQLRYKRAKVAENLRRLGGFAVSCTDAPSDGAVYVEPVIGMDDPWGYRNKFQVPVRRAKDGRIVMGFYAGRTHSVIETPHCYLGIPVYDEIFKTVKQFMEAHGVDPYDEETGKGIVRNVMVRRGSSTGQIMVCVVINARRLPHADTLAKALTGIPGVVSVSLNINTGRDNVLMGDKVIPLAGDPFIEEKIGALTYRISPLSFFQVNPVQTEKLYGKVLEFAGLTGKETVWDLYCGTGTISLFLAEKAAQVYGIEIVPEAVKDAEHNAAMNSIDNAAFFCGEAEKIFPEMVKSGAYQRADAAVIDPPRKGCDPALLEALLAVMPEKIVYVSCDSATLARDLKILCAEGRYGIERVQPVDMFPWTVHVETVCLLTHN